MNYRWDKKYLYWGLTAFTVLCLAILFYYMLFHGYNISLFFKKAGSICSPIIDGLIIAFLIAPLVNWVESRFFFPYYTKKGKKVSEQKLKVIRIFSMFISFILVISLLSAFFITIIPQIVFSVENIYAQSSIYKENIEDWMNESFTKNPEVKKFITDTFTRYSGELSEWVNVNLVPQLQNLVKTVSLSLIGFLKAIWNVLIGTIISLYLLFNKEKFSGQIKKMSYGIFGIKNGNSVVSNMRMINDKFSGFIIGKLLDSLIIGIMCFIGTSILKFPYPILISLIIGVTNIVPFFGPIIGAIPCALLIFIINPLQTIYFLIFILALQQFDGNILGPKILGVSTGLSSFWVIFAITVFGGIWGVPGMIIGVPLMAVIFVGIKTFLTNRLDKKGISSDTKDYTNLDYIDDKKENSFIELPRAFQLEEPKEKNRTNVFSKIFKKMFGK